MVPPEKDAESVFPLLNDLDRVIHSPARLMILTYLYVVESGDMVYLVNQTGLSWGNLATHVNKLEEAGYIEIEKEFRGRKPFTMLHLTEKGREAYRQYRKQMMNLLDDLPD